MHFAHVLRHFLETILKKKSVLNRVFMSNFRFGKCMQNTCKNRPEMKAFSVPYETLCLKSLKKRAINGVFVSNFHFGKCMQNTGKNRLEMNGISLYFETLCGDKFEKNRAKTVFL